MRINLKVPYAEKDEAKKHGARWDSSARVWYVDNLSNLGPLMKWASEDLTKAYGENPAKFKERMRVARELMEGLSGSQASHLREMMNEDN